MRQKNANPRYPEPISPVSGDDISRYGQPFQALNVRAFLFCSLAVAGLSLIALPAGAEMPKVDTPSGQPLPRWAMLRKGEVYARTGPSKDNPIAWTYKAQSLPVQIISETHDWRLVCDPDGGVAWVSKTMLQSQKTVLSPNGARLELRAAPKADSPVKAILKERSLASLDTCKKGWCKLSAGGATGWTPMGSVWGTQEVAVCQRPTLFQTARE